MIIGVDTGGTFTDTVLISDSGEQIVAKSSTTPAKPSEGVLNSVGKAAERVGHTLESLLPEVDVFAHGTTIVTNLAIERDGATVGLLTTYGHEDTQEIGRVTSRHAGLATHELKDYVNQSKGEPFSTRQFVRGIDERIDRDGDIVVPLDESAIRDATADLLSKGADVIAINFLWSFRNSEHEERARELIEDEFDVPVFISSETTGRIGEYERGATTAALAHVTPAFSSYVENLHATLREKGLEAPFFLMQSNGGIIPIAEAKANGIAMIGSGPAAGVSGAVSAGPESGVIDTGTSNIICTDVGGTSFDVGLVVDSEPEFTSTLNVGKHTLYQQAVNIESIGNGGGSIVWIGSKGELNIGPESAGGNPGPVCYGRGNDQPTVTDADLVLGYLDPEYFLGGDIDLDLDASRRAIESKIGNELGLSLNEAAKGIYDLMNAQMADLIRKMTVEKGYDPREFNVFAYGGAGPVHAAGYADTLGIQKVTVPLGNVASVFSAMGLTFADIRYEEARSMAMEPPFDREHMQETITELKGEIGTQLGSSLFSEDDIECEIALDMRYQGQHSELMVSVPESWFAGESSQSLQELFEQRYAKRFGEAATYESGTVEVVTLRVVGEIETGAPDFRTQPRSEVEPTPDKHRPIVWDDSPVETPIYYGETLEFGHTLTGPAVIQLPSTTIPVPPEKTSAIRENGSIDIILGGAADE